MGKQTKNWQKSLRPVIRRNSHGCCKSHVLRYSAEAGTRIAWNPEFQGELRLPGMTIYPYFRVFCINPSLKNNEVMAGEEFGGSQRKTAGFWDRKGKDTVSALKLVNDLSLFDESQFFAGNFLDLFFMITKALNLLGQLLVFLAQAVVGKMNPVPFFLANDRSGASPFLRRAPRTS